MGDLTGKKFGKLTVLSKTDDKKNGSYLYKCKCDCGNVIKVRTDSLTGGKVISCGCSKKGKEKSNQLLSSRKIVDHTSKVFFKGTISKNNHTGVNGVCFSNGRYIASIGYKGKVYQLLTTKEFGKAVLARKEAEQHIFKDFEEWYAEWRIERK